LALENYGLAYGIICVILRLAALIQCWLVTDRQTDRRTHDGSIYRVRCFRANNTGTLCETIISYDVYFYRATLC